MQVYIVIEIYERINDMYQKQKEKAMELLKNNEKNRDYTNRYWIPYADYLDPADCFSTFSCDYLDGKQGYLDLIDNLLRADQTAKVFVELYGCDSFDGKPCINAETLILFSRLPLSDIEHIFQMISGKNPISHSQLLLLTGMAARSRLRIFPPTAALSTIAGGINTVHSYPRATPVGAAGDDTPHIFSIFTFPIAEALTQMQVSAVFFLKQDFSAQTFSATLAA